jgi:cytochrome d ubiquinol oxidase subunit I
VHQPLKLAAMEGLPNTTADAPFAVGGYWDKSEDEIQGGVEIPDMLSLLAFHNPNAVVTGLNSVPEQDQPHAINTIRYSFHAMVGVGTVLALLGAFFVFMWARHRRLPRSKWFYRLVAISGVLSIIALEAGWIVTEVGRQPWIAYGVMRVSDAVTHANGVTYLFAAGVVIYSSLVAMVVWLLRRLAKTPEHVKGEDGTEQVPT